MTQLVALTIFIGVYAVILAGENSPRKLDRPAAGMIGGVLMVVGGVLTRSEALAAIDFGTLMLLFGMMVVIHYASVSGLLDRLADRLVAGSSNPYHLLWKICLSAGVLSALFVNDTICLLMTPLILKASRRERLAAEPYLLALATSSNVGSVMALTGNPQNMLVGQSSHWTWAAFSLRMIPIGMLCLGINGLVISKMYAGRLRVVAEVKPPEETSEDRPFDGALAYKTIVIMAGLLVAFLAGAPMDVAALAAAVAIIVLANRKPEETFAAVDWSLLLFFAGLFVVVQGITKSEGAWISRLVPMFSNHHSRLGELTLFSVGTVAGSNLFSNVPFVMLVRGWVTNLPHAPALWLALASASTFAGNLTLVGSVANLIVAHGARNQSPLSFRAFLRVGVVTTSLTVGASVLILWIYGNIGWAG